MILTFSLLPPRGRLKALLCLLLFLATPETLDSIRLYGSQRKNDNRVTKRPALRTMFESSPKNKHVASVGMVLPPSYFKERYYWKKIKETINEFIKKNKDSYFIKNYDFNHENVIVQYMDVSSSPTTILNTLCTEFLGRGVSAILYLYNVEAFGRSTASTQYFFQLAGYLGIPVISWNADNSGLEQRTSGLQLQLAPSIEHQASAMIAIIRRYSWTRFAVVTTHIAGHNDFLGAVRDVLHQQGTEDDREESLELIDTFVIHSVEKDMPKLTVSEARIFLLYCTRDEAVPLMKTAKKLSLTEKNYLWIVTQSVIQSVSEAPHELPIGMLGVHFSTSDDAMIDEIGTSLMVFAHGAKNYVDDGISRHPFPELSASISCDFGDAMWKEGSQLYRFLKNVRVNMEDETEPNLEFNSDGTRKSVELKIMNLRRQDQGKQLIWEEIGSWYSWKKGLDVNDIVWPGYSHVPPDGMPEKFHLKVVFMEELPFIKMDSPDPKSGKCPTNKGILCRVATDEMMMGVNISMAMKDEKYYQCCSGFCIDFLVQLSRDLGFSYEFTRVEDGIWGAIVNGKWTGLPGAIINGKADMIMTSIKINSQREEVLDFSIPFLDTGITMVVSKRTGIISATAFLEPFDTASWLLVGAVAIQVATFSIFIFEWLSPLGFNMKFRPAPGHRFSLLRNLWLVWAILFQAAVNIDVPRSVTGRFMGNVWAMFALIFLAIYTANLAAFMITREEFYALSGLEDKKLQNPTSVKPPFRFATTLHGNTDVLIKKSYPEMHTYMRQFNQSNPIEGVKSVKKGLLDAFLYDATVLEYLSGQDDECRLLTVGSWFALTGYGVAFPRNSKYIPLFNEQIMKYRANGYLERLTRFWFTGACKHEHQYKSSSKPLSLEQFMSTFFLLGCGIVIGFLTLSLEYLYFNRRAVLSKRKNISNLVSLFSMSMVRSLHVKPDQPSDEDPSHGNSVEEECKSYELWQARHDLDLAQIRIYYLKKQLEHTLASKPRASTSSEMPENSSSEKSQSEDIRFPILHTIKWTPSDHLRYTQEIPDIEEPVELSENNPYQEPPSCSKSKRSSQFIGGKIS